MHPLLANHARRLAASSATLPALPPALPMDEALTLTALPETDNPDLFAVASLCAALAVERTAERSGPRVETCGIINARSGRCPEDCAFCAQSARYHTGAPVYPLLDADSLLRRAEELAAAGALRFGIVTSGTALSEAECEALCRAVERIVRAVDIRVCASIGQVTEERARALREAGVTRYHHNLETSASFFPSICSTHPYEEDLRSLRAARSAGLELCCGGIFGLGESWAQRLELSATLDDLDVDAIPVNFLSPIPGTPLAARPRLSPQEALRITALFRLLHPSRAVIICGGRASTLGAWQSWLLAAGASALMIGNYLTTSGNPFADDREMLRLLGFASR